MASKKVTFPSGKETTVYSVPPKFYDEITAAYPDPPVPVIKIDGSKEETRTATGENMLVKDPNDPAYKAACAEMVQKRNTKWMERVMLRGLKDIRPPDGWQVSEELVAEQRYILEDTEWQGRPGGVGRILDYIEYEFFESPADHSFLMTTVNELSDVPKEVADAIEATFPGDVEVQGEGQEAAGKAD